MSLHSVNVADHEKMSRFVDEVLAEGEYVDILINNARITLTPTEFEKIPEN